MLAAITLLEFTAANPILAVILAFFFVVMVVGVFQSFAHMVTGKPVPPPKSPFDVEDKS
jgi:dolichyl-phosphate-mannose--protein O-mannosyl transferase